MDREVWILWLPAHKPGTAHYFSLHQSLGFWLSCSSIIEHERGQYRNCMSGVLSIQLLIEGSIKCLRSIQRADQVISYMCGAYSVEFVVIIEGDVKCCCGVRTRRSHGKSYYSDQFVGNLENALTG